MPINKTERIIAWAREHGGAITPAEVTALGASRGNLQHLLVKGVLERGTRGVYFLQEGWPDEFYSLQARYSRGVFSHETALYLWGLTDRTPQSFRMTFPTGYNLGRVKQAGVRCTQCLPDWHGMGVETVRTPSGCRVRVYNRERTLCDILRSRPGTDIQVVTDAFKRYASSRDKNLPRLAEYARQLGVSGKVNTYMEVLL